MQLPDLHAQEATLLLAGLSSGWLVQVTHRVCPCIQGQSVYHHETITGTVAKCLLEGGMQSQTTASIASVCIVLQLQ